MVQKIANVKNKKWFLDWLKGHKVVTGFFALFIILIAYLIGSWTVLQIQIHQERKRFEAATKLITNLNTSSLNAKSVKFKECNYSSNGGIFAQKILGCSTNLIISYPNISKDNALVLANNAAESLKAKHIDLKQNYGGRTIYSLSNYIFKYKNIHCGLISEYYTSDILYTERYSEATQTGIDFIISVDCSGPAKAEYFPVMHD